MVKKLLIVIFLMTQPVAAECKYFAEADVVNDVLVNKKLIININVILILSSYILSIIVITTKIKLFSNLGSVKNLIKKLSFSLHV